MNHPISFEELTPLEQCIANKALFAKLLSGAAQEAKHRQKKKKSAMQCAAEMQ